MSQMSDTNIFKMYVPFQELILCEQNIYSFMVSQIQQSLQNASAEFFEYKIRVC